MALTEQDLNNIQNVVAREVGGLRDDMFRMESRILAATGIAERDAVDRLDDHERRIRKLEQSRSNGK